MQSAASFRRMRRLLKDAAAEMRRVTSQPMHTPQDPTTSPSSKHLKASRVFRYQPFEWPTDSQQTEFSLSTELLQGMQSIVICRQRIFTALADIPNDDARQCTFIPPIYTIIAFL